MTADPWDGPVCPACKGKGQIVYQGRSWISVACVDCHGTGLAEGAPPAPQYRPDGFRTPEDGEEYSPAVHGPIPDGCWLCSGERVVGTARRPCPACRPAG